MKLFLINLLLFISSLITVAGQTPLSDSIKRILHKTWQDTSRILLMADLANQYQFFNSDSAIIIAQQAIGEAQKMKYLSGEIVGLIALGEIYRNRGDYPQALEKLFTALGKSRNIHDAVGEANSMCFIGIVYMEVSEYRQALN